MKENACSPEDPSKHKDGKSPGVITPVRHLVMLCFLGQGQPEKVRVRFENCVFGNLKMSCTFPFFLINQA